MSRTQNFRGIVIKKRPFTEGSLIITALTEDGHKQEWVAKGIARPRSKRKHHVESMNLISGTTYEGRNHRYLQEVSCLKSFSKLKDNLEELLRFQLILEIIDNGIFQDDPHPKIYELLESSLHEMNQNPHPFTVEATLIKLAHYLGFLPSFKECGHCHKEILADEAHWDPQERLLHCHNCSHKKHPFPLKYRKALEFFRRADLSQVHHVNLSQEEHLQLKNFLPELFMHHFQRPLKSLALQI
jgi:DNA repair protein RecO (recombination protein O)